MSNHSGSYMLNDLLKLMDQEHLFEGLGMKKTQSLIRRFVGMAQSYDCNGGEILEKLPGRIQRALLAHARKTQYPLEMVLEMAIAGFLDNEAITFADCHPSQIESGSRA